MTTTTHTWRPLGVVEAADYPHGGDWQVSDTFLRYFEGPDGTVLEAGFYVEQTREDGPYYVSAFASLTLGEAGGWDEVDRWSGDEMPATALLSVLLFDDLKRATDAALRDAERFRPEYLGLGEGGEA